MSNKQTAADVMDALSHLSPEEKVQFGVRTLSWMFQLDLGDEEEQARKTHAYLVNNKDYLSKLEDGLGFRTLIAMMEYVEANDKMRDILRWSEVYKAISSNPHVRDFANDWLIDRNRSEVVNADWFDNLRPRDIT